MKFLVPSGGRGRESGTRVDAPSTIAGESTCTDERGRLGYPAVERLNLATYAICANGRAGGLIKLTAGVGQFAAKILL